LREVVAELVPQLRQSRSAWLLQWAVFDSSFAAASEGAWDEAQALVEEALEVNRDTGFRAYTGYFRAHLGWYARLSGDLDTAIARGRTAVAETSPVDHPWWYAAAAGLLSSALLEAGESAEAESLARRALTVAGPEAPEAWRLRCLAPLAVNTGHAGEKAFVEARHLLGAIECPPGKAWVPGADCYLQVARAAELRDDLESAALALAPLRAAVDRSWESVRERVDAQLGQISSATS
jgi:tetratricopeptide (TPR) repeat protein